MLNNFKKNLFDQTIKEVNVFATMPHTHLKGIMDKGSMKGSRILLTNFIFQIGKELYTTLIRNGTEIAYIANNRYYDFNYQYYNFLNNPVVIKQVRFSSNAFFLIYFDI